MITNKTHHNLMNMHVNKTNNSTKKRSTEQCMHINYTHDINAKMQTIELL